MLFSLLLSLVPFLLLFFFFFSLPQGGNHSVRSKGRNKEEKWRPKERKEKRKKEKRKNTLVFESN